MNLLRNALSRDQRRIIAGVALCFGLIVRCGSAQGAPSTDKAGYTLFNPVPAEMVRELSPDRPDKTESPYTLDAGHFSLEMDFANYTFDKSDNITTMAWNIAPFNFKAGLLNNVDVQIVFDGYKQVSSEDHAEGITAIRSGVGDLTARVKINMWGDETGKTAFAVLPYVKFPTSTDSLGNNSVEGGIICPFALKLPGGFDLGLETAVGFLHDGGDNNYHEDFINSITLDHAIIGKFSGYLEFFSEIGTEPRTGWAGTIDAGVEFLATENVQFDCGCNFGVTPVADGFNPFAGITIRF